MRDRNQELRTDEGGGEPATQSKLVMQSDSILLQVGDSKIVLEANGTISLDGLKIRIDGKELVDVTSDTIDLN